VATQNPQRVELGEMLRRARETAGLPPTRVETELGWYAGKISRVERGQRVPVRAEVNALADLYKLSSDERETLHVLADAARKRESPSRVADFAQTYVTLERGAAEIRYFDEVLIPALLQTEAYARTVLAHSRAQHVDEQVADRLARQGILTRADPPDVQVVLGESALYRMVGGQNVMDAQIKHLLEVGDLPNVEIRILPFSVGAHRAFGVGFTFLRLATPSITRVYIEGQTDATYIHEPDECATYEEDFGEVWAMASDQVRSATILRRRIGIERRN
jgi:transcriptional regulator with XRE-family HTH domain